MMWWNHGSWGAGDWLAMSFMMAFFWVLVIALVLWLVRSSRQRSVALTTQQQQAPSAETLLAERFARGEIDEAEFTNSRTILRIPADAHNRRTRR